MLVESGVSWYAVGKIAYQHLLDSPVDGQHYAFHVERIL